MQEILSSTPPTQLKSVYKTNYGRKAETTTDERKVNKERSRQLLRQWRAKHGLNRATGFVLPKTNIFLPFVKQNTLYDSPWFDGIPHTCIRDFPKHRLETLMALEIELIKRTRTGDLAEHKYGANKGVNIGKSVVSGGSHACKTEGISGSIHDAKAAKENKDLKVQVWDTIVGVLHDAFHNELWFRRQVHLCAQLNKQSGEERTIPNSPISGIWMSFEGREEAIHCDRNIVGAIFVLSLYQPEPGSATLCVMSEGGNVKKVALLPMKVLGGTWGATSHCNLGLDHHATEFRRSWTLYLDGRVFGRNYKFCTN